MKEIEQKVSQVITYCQLICVPTLFIKAYFVLPVSIVAL